MAGAAGFRQRFTAQLKSLASAVRRRRTPAAKCRVRTVAKVPLFIGPRVSDVSPLFLLYHLPVPTHERPIQAASTTLPARDAPLGRGEAAPWFEAPVLAGHDRFALHAVGGRAVLMLFFGSAGHPAAQAALRLLEARRSLFDDERACFFGITVDRDDAAQKRVRSGLGVRFVLDPDRAISRAYGAAVDDDGNTYHPHWLLLDRMLRVTSIFTLSDGASALAAFEALAMSAPAPDWAPVVMVPDVLEPELCRKLIDLYDANGGRESGFMREVGGKTKEVLDPAMKVRRDYLIDDREVARPLNLRLLHRVFPIIYRAYQFRASRIERLVVGCYEAEVGGHFQAHRDNTTRGTAHRQFAVTINLNADEYEGGDLAFPEFGPRSYRAPTGAAIVFSCSLLHRAMPVTRGRRFALLPFLYDEESARLREQNAHFLEGAAANYKVNMDRMI